MEYATDHDKYRLTLELAAVGIAHVGLDGRFLDANRAMCDLFGYSRDELLERSVYDLSLPDDAAVTGDVRARLHSGEISSFQKEKRYVRKDGSIVWADLKIAVRRGEDGRVLYDISVIEDITARKEAEAQVRAHAERLATTNQRLTTVLDELAELQSATAQASKLESIGRLAAGVAHEINTPVQFVTDNTRFAGEAIADLMAVIDAAQRLADATEDVVELAPLRDAFHEATAAADLDFLRSELPMSIEQTLHGTSHLAAIVRGLKDFAHPGNGRHTDCDVNRAIDAALAVSRNEWKLVADVVFDPDPGLPPIPADAGQLQQALLILIVNAAQAIAEHRRSDRGTIRVATDWDDESLRIVVSDDGPGVPDEIRDRIFDPFFTTKGLGDGTGQGLYVAHSVITKAHGGDLTLTTSPEGGASFVVRLPRTVGDALEQAPAPAP